MNDALEETKKNTILTMLSTGQITIEQLIQDKSLSGNILNGIAISYWSTPVVALQLCHAAHEKKNSFASYNAGLITHNHGFLPVIQQYKLSQTKIEKDKNLNDAKSHAKNTIFYLTTAKDRGFPNRTDADNLLFDIYTKFFEIDASAEADTAFRALEETSVSADSIYGRALLAYEEGKNNEAVALLTAGFNKSGTKDLLYHKLFSLDDSKGEYNKILTVLIISLPSTTSVLSKIISTALRLNHTQVLEILLEHGLDPTHLNLDEAETTVLSLSPLMDQYNIIDLGALKSLQHQELTGKTTEELEALKKEILNKPGVLIDQNRIQYLEQINRVIAIQKFPNKHRVQFNKKKATEKKHFPTPNNSPQYYLWNGKHLIALPDGKNKIEIINKLITTLLYKAKRYGFLSEPCENIKKVIVLLDSRLQGFSEQQFQLLIERREKRSQDFFGEEISEDSDDELNPNEAIDPASLASQRQTVETLGIFWVKEGVKNLNLATAKKSFQNRKDKLLPKRKKLPNNGQPYQDFNSRVVIPHESLPPDIFAQAKNDLIVLNRHLKNGMPISQAISKVKTKFFVAQYRGSSYLASKWNAPSRRAHRKTDETKMPTFSASVYQAAQFRIFTEFNPDKYKSEETQSLLKLIAEKLESMLLSMRKTGDYKNTENNIIYDNLSELIQDLYSKDYGKFHTALSATGILKEFKGKFFLNDKNPFVSTGDRPYHALRYAYGTKPYAGNEGERLRPRWKKTGRAERPYSGKIYISLHPLTDYDEKGPMHVVSLIDQGKLSIINNIVAERETTFPAYIKEDRVVYQQVAKYPSFDKDYRPRYLKKYGLDQELYDLFRGAFKKHPPHSYENRYLKKILGNWLCAYHEKRLIEIAFEKAVEKGGILIYKGKENTFEFILPEFGVQKNRLNQDEINLSRQYRKNK